MDESTKRAQSIVGTNNDGGRPQHDFYPTPRRGTTSLLDVENFSKYIWECACGDGAMTRILEEYGYECLGSDIEPRGDFEGHTPLDFLECPYLYAPNIITNPPFILAQEFAEHALDLGTEKVALLCKLAFLEGQKRAAWLEGSPLKKVYVFKKRLTLYRNGVKMKNSGMIAFAWFVWEKDWTRTPEIGWI